MGIIDNLSNNVRYTLDMLGKNPEAEKYAAELRKKEEAKKREEEDAKLTEEEKKKKEAERKAADEALLKKKQMDTFQMSTMIGSGVSTATTIVFIGLIICTGILGASLATNLNVYRDWAFRIFYFVYGFIFSPIVIVYVYLYRWWWQGKRPRFYALFPLIPYRLDHPWTAQFFSWLSFRPDDAIEQLKEWQPSSR
jgi:hypothetical protein